MNSGRTLPTRQELLMPTNTQPDWEEIANHVETLTDTNIVTVFDVLSPYRAQLIVYGGLHETDLLDIQKEYRIVGIDPIGNNEEQTSDAAVLYVTVELTAHSYAQIIEQRQ